MTHDTRKSDVWSLGVTFFEILCGRTPFEEYDGDALQTKQDVERYWSRTVCQQLHSNTPNHTHLHFLAPWQVGWPVEVLGEDGEAFEDDDVPERGFALHRFTGARRWVLEGQ